MQGLPIATHPRDLSIDWLTATLRSAGVLEAQRRITDFTSQAVGTGQMSNSYRLFLAFDGETGAPATLIAKLPSDDERSRAAGAGAYHVEVSFYQEFAADLDVRTPRCYFAAIHDNNVDFVLLLEDLAPAAQGDQLTGCTLAQAELAVTEAVKLHAPLIGDPRLESPPWVNTRSSGQMGMFVQSSYPGFRERYTGTIDEPILEMGERFMGKLARYYSWNRGRQSLTHTDYRLDNLLFGTEAGGPPIAVVDWQTTRSDNPLLDIAYFVGASLLSPERKRVERDLVHLYHERMVSAGVEGFSFDDCWRDYRLYSYEGFHMAVLASMLVQRTERGDEMFRVMAARHGQQILDLNSEALL